jgi:hypothetical protein
MRLANVFTSDLTRASHSGSWMARGESTAQNHEPTLQPPQRMKNGTPKSSRMLRRSYSPVHEAAKKLKLLSFRGTPRAEESLLLFTLEPREIPHFVRNDKIAYFFRSLSCRE